MSRSHAQTWLAIALLLAGVVLLLVNLGVFGDRESATKGALFAVGGIVFLGLFVRDRGHWWVLIRGCTLLGLGATALFGPTLGVWSGAGVSGRCRPQKCAGCGGPRTSSSRAEVQDAPHVFQKMGR